MTLTRDDLVQIRNIVEDVVDVKLEQKLDLKFSEFEQRFESKIDEKLDLRFRESEQHLEHKIDKKLEPLYGEMQAIRNDLKDIYQTLADIDKLINRKPVSDKGFMKLSDKEQLLWLNDMLLATAKRLNVDLPR